MNHYQIDIQSFNGTWTSDVFSTAYEAYIFITGLTDAAQVEVNNINVSSLEALDKWYATETAQPTDEPAVPDAAQPAQPNNAERVDQLIGHISRARRELADYERELADLTGQGWGITDPAPAPKEEE
jgi:hypothetical protein